MSSSHIRRNRVSHENLIVSANRVARIGCFKAVEHHVVHVRPPVKGLRVANHVESSDRVLSQWEFLPVLGHREHLHPECAVTVRLTWRRIALRAAWPRKRGYVPVSKLIWVWQRILRLPQDNAHIVLRHNDVFHVHPGLGRVYHDSSLRERAFNPALMPAGRTDAVEHKRGNRRDRGVVVEWNILLQAAGGVWKYESDQIRALANIIGYHNPVGQRVVIRVALETRHRVDPWNCEGALHRADQQIPGEREILDCQSVNEETRATRDDVVSNREPGGLINVDSVTSPGVNRWICYRSVPGRALNGLEIQAGVSRVVLPAAV